jgi:hypothetical protein
MLDKLKELSITIWDPIGNIFYYLFDSSNIWVPIIGFFLTTFLTLYVTRKVLDKFIELPLIKILQVFLKFLFKIFIYLLILGIFVSLALYLQSLYIEHDEQVVKKQQSVDYLLL